MENKELNYKTPEKIEKYHKVIDYLKDAHKELSECLEGKNRRGILTDILNTIYTIQKDYLNEKQ